MAKHAFTSENQPTNRRRSNFLTRLDQALRDGGREENAVMDEAVRRAFNDQDPQSAQILSALLARISPPLKPTTSPVEFDFIEGATAADKIDSLLVAVSRGALCADIAARIAGLIADSVKIREHCELVARLERVEALLAEAPK